MMTSAILVIFRAVAIGALSAAGTTAYGAIPGQPNPDDVKTIDVCMANASKTSTDPDTCIGQVTTTCLKNSPSATAKQCTDREFLVWEAALNRDYAQLNAFLADDGVKQALRDEQRDFIIARLKKCTFERIAHKNAPESLAAAAQCNVKATARQELWVLEQINSFKPH
jgi:uncharacterized protein YecT (DUF1311 family)